MINKEQLKKELPQFRQTAQDFLDKKLSVVEFKGKSGGMGVYAEKGGQSFMIRLRTHGGIVSLPHMKKIYEYATKYKLDTIHITTRQAVQLHRLSLDGMMDIMEDAISHDLFTRGGGGNFPRNVAISPLASVEKEEIFDVTKYALLVEEYLLTHMFEYHLPRKLKIAFSSSEKDLANAKINDLGFIATKKDGKEYFKVYMAGGIGGNPKTAIAYPELISPEEVLIYVSAIIHLFVKEGDYENKNRARIRFIAERMGEEGFISCYQSLIEEVRRTEKEELESFANEFYLTYVDRQENYGSVLKKEEIEDSVSLENVLEDTSYQEKLQNIVLEETPYLIPQKQLGRYTLLLHPVGGQMKVEDWAYVLNKMEAYGLNDVRISMDETMYVRNLTASQVIEIVKEKEYLCPKSKFACSVSCIGAPICQIGMQTSQQMLMSCFESLKENNICATYLPKIQISGCPNSCGRHQTASLGFSGTRKRVGDEVKNCFSVFVGGGVGEGVAKLGEEIGVVPMEHISQMIMELANKLNEVEKEFDVLLQEDKKSIVDIISNYTV